MSTPKTYCEALNKTLHEIMQSDDRVVILGACCISSPWYVGNTMIGLQEKFPGRIVDGPVSENGVTGMAVGMAIAGMRPIVVFPRMDFMFYALDPIINQAAKWHFMSGGRAKVPIVFWSIINRGNSQGCQHSQDLRWIFSRIDGLTIYEGRGPQSVERQLRMAVKDDNPSMFFDNRDKYDLTEELPSLFATDRRPIHMMPMPSSQSLEKLWFARYGR